MLRLVLCVVPASSGSASATNKSRLQAWFTTYQGSVSLYWTVIRMVWQDRIYTQRYRWSRRIWRIDLKTDKAQVDGHQVRQFGECSFGVERPKLEDDRRFCTQPVLVRTINKVGNMMGTKYLYSERPFDAVLIGGGEMKSSFLGERQL